MSQESYLILRTYYGSIHKTFFVPNMETPPLSPLPTSEMMSPLPETSKPSPKRKLIFGLLGGVIGLLILTGAFAGYKYYEYVSTPVWSANDIVKYIGKQTIENINAHARVMPSNTPREEHLSFSYEISASGAKNPSNITNGNLTTRVSIDGYVEPSSHTGLALFDTQVHIDITGKGEIKEGDTLTPAQANLSIKLETKSPDGENIYFRLSEASVALSGSEMIPTDMIENIDKIVAPYRQKWFVYNVETDTTKLL